MGIEPHFLSVMNYGLEKVTRPTSTLFNLGTRGSKNKKVIYENFFFLVKMNSQKFSLFYLFCLSLSAFRVCLFLVPLPKKDTKQRIDRETKM